MASPFPGMDPFLEGSEWPDLHHELASQIRKQLVPKISPKYIARIERYVVKDDNPKSEFGVMYPDVDLFLSQSANRADEPVVSYSNEKPPTPIDFSLPFFSPIDVRIPKVEIRDREGNELVTSIEILSPVNKRKPGLEPYLAKRAKLRQEGIHLLEIDLLRRGTRPVQDPRLEGTPYMVALTRANDRQTDVWKVQLHKPLPVIPVPLRRPDEDVAIDLQEALKVIYEEAAYHLSVRYDLPPPPPSLSEEDQVWIQEILAQKLGI